MMHLQKLKIAASIVIVTALAIGGASVVAAAQGKTAEKSAASQPAAEPQPTDPRSALAKLAKAIRDGDEQTIKECSVASDPADQPLIDRQAKTCKVVAEFKAAYTKAFGPAAARRLPAMVGPTTVPANAVVKIKGNNATVTVSGVPLPMVKVGQTWKFPSSAMAMKSLPMPVDEVVEFDRCTAMAIAETTEAINLGQFETPKQALDDLTKRSMAAYAAMQKPKSSSTTSTPAH